MTIGLDLDVALHSPEIPPNTGNIIRLCANTGCRLHLLQPLGFTLDNTKMRRAGLDYRDLAVVHVHAGLAAFLMSVQPTRLFAITTKGTRRYTDYHYQTGDALLFGSETRGLPPEVMAQIPAPHRLRIPMCPEVRSLNLANAVAVAVYEAWRQRGFMGGE